MHIKIEHLDDIYTVVNMIDTDPQSAEAWGYIKAHTGAFIGQKGRKEGKKIVWETAEAVKERNMTPLTKLEFRNLFTTKEKIALDDIEMGVQIPNIPAEILNQSRTMLKDIAAATHVDRWRNDVLMGVLMMKQFKLLEKDTRAVEIIAAYNDITPDEAQQLILDTAL